MSPEIHPTGHGWGESTADANIAITPTPIADR